MKYLLFIFCLWVSTAHSQVKPTKRNKCPAGYVYQPHFSDDYVIIKRGCYTKNELKGIWARITEHVQMSTREFGDSIWLTSIDTIKVKVYNVVGETCLDASIRFTDSLTQARAKYDTIGPQLRIVSDVGTGWNPVNAMWVYEVRLYKSEWITVDPNAYQKDETGQIVSGTLMPIHNEQRAIPRHFAWLDSKKKPLKLAVWAAKLDQ